MNNFISLMKKGFYDGTIFHRVIPGFMIQGGDPEGTGMGGPGYGIKGEFAMNGLRTTYATRPACSRWPAASARTPRAASSSSWSTTRRYLDGQYAAFGKVIEGIDVAQAICPRPVTGRTAP